MKGVNLAENGHVATLLFPASAQTESSYFSMKNHAKANIIVMNGAAITAGTLTCKRAEDSSGTGASAINVSYYLEATSGGDTLAARVTSTSSLTWSSGSCKTIVIDIDASELTASSPWINVNVDAGNVVSGPVCAVAVLTGARYAGDGTSPTVLS